MAVLALLMVSYINAFNFMDGVNGISALNGLVVGVVFVATGYQYQVPVAMGLGAALAGVSLAFLPFNFRGRVFLGDVGSYAYGSAIAVTGMMSYVVGVPWQLVLAPISIYLIDTGITLLMRAVRREPLMAPHRNHVYQRLADELSHLSAAGINATAGFLATVAAWVSVSVGAVLGYVLFLVVAASYLASPYVARFVPRYLELSD